LEDKIMDDFELDLDSLTLRMFDDGRFKVILDGKVLYDKERTGRFPNYDVEIKGELAARVAG
jgi:predicted Rdx family selenoprotein